jgi:(4-O-methyl)-D-glucuronate---lignin esterase
MTFSKSSVFWLAASAGLALAIHGEASAQAPDLVAPASAPAPAPKPSAPAPFDSNSDRGRMLTLLGLPMPPARAAGSNTTDESKARPADSKYPDPLVLNNGQPVKDAATWWKVRRGEIFEEFAREVYGRIPPNTPKVTWEVTKTDDDGKVKTKTITGHIDNARFPALSPTIALTLKTPSEATGPVPVVVYAQAFGGFGPRAGAPPAAGAPVAAPGTAPAAAPNAATSAPAPAGRGRGPGGPNQLQTLTLAKGWGYATFDTNTVQPDSAAGLTQGIIGLMNQGEMRTKPDEWGVLMAWSWGLSKSIDYFETDRDVDARQLAVDGFSRWGKTAVLAAAVDSRWALAWAGDSGEGGTKMNRRNFGETVDMVAQNFPYWMAGNFQKYVGHWEAMTVDAHELVALVAPRPVFITGGTTDLHTDPKGMFEAAALASPVYELLGRKGLGTITMPEADVALISGDVGYRMHTGAHTPAPDYETFLEFCAKYFKAPPAKR